MEPYPRALGLHPCVMGGDRQALGRAWKWTVLLCPRDIKRSEQRMGLLAQLHRASPDIGVLLTVPLVMLRAGAPVS